MNESLLKITLRKGMTDDLSELQRLFFETVMAVCSADYDALQIKVWASSIENVKRWNEIMTNQLVLVALDGNKIVGFISLDKGNYIDLLYVHKEYQRKGVAHKLYTKIEETAKQQGQKEFSSDVSITARPFFEKFGFKVVTEQTIVRQGIALTNFKMVKNLR